MSIQLPNTPVPLIDQKTGQISVPWYQALLKITSTVTGALVSSVNISGNNGITVAGSPITTAGVITLGIGNLTCASAQVAGTVTSANERTGGIVATGTITAANVVAIVAVQSVNLSSSGTITGTNVIITGTLTSAGIINAGTITTGNVIASGTISTVELISTGTLTTNDVVILGALTFMKPLTTSLAADVSLTNSTSYFDGPSVSTGGVGTWYASGTITFTDASAPAAIQVKLWDGSALAASVQSVVPNAGNVVSVSVSGWITTPAGPIKISVKDPSFTTGKMLFNQSGNSKDCTINAFRIA